MTPTYQDLLPPQWQARLCEERPEALQAAVNLATVEIPHAETLSHWGMVLSLNFGGLVDEAEGATPGFSA